ncbi:hypothetical protein [Clostridium fallax]|uniref:WG containing repeat-containing protein n=1 Tax=Clostridium fallax TaxID=1533 RepID=A0A1M4UIC1_9CLOT|nr:hypothetical protein [Clostridium fallax]SHE56313.1 hypothetical protein SAMN05443638_10527 [Clostridium fallax]SQB07572.1 Uncharacterised protein [Clostridium fallax]
MKKTIIIGTIIIFIISFLFIYSNKKNNLNSESTLLLYNDKTKETFSLDNKLEKTKIGENISNVIYSSNLQEYISIDENFNLYFTKKDGKKEFIDSNILPNSFRQCIIGSLVYYINNKNDLYIKDSGKEKVKLASDVIKFHLLDENSFYYVDKNLNLFFVNNNNKPLKITENSSICQFNSDKSKVLYFKKDIIYLKNLKTGKEEALNNNSIGNYFFFINNKDILYGEIPNENMENLDLDATILYYKKYNSPSQKLDDSVSLYFLTNDKKGVYYLKSDNTLNYIDLENLKKFKLCDDVTSIKNVYNDAFILDSSNNLFIISPTGEKKSLPKNFKEIKAFKNSLIILTKDNKLYKNDKEISSNVKSFNVSLDSLAYVNYKNQVYFSKNEEPPKKVLENAKEYANIKIYQNNYTQCYNNINKNSSSLTSTVYEKSINLDDLYGFWVNKNFNTDFIKVEDGKFTFLNIAGEDTGDVTILKSSENFMLMEFYNSEIKNNIDKIEYNDNSFTFRNNTYIRIDEKIYNDFLFKVNNSKEIAKSRLNSEIKLINTCYKDNKIYFIYTKRNNINSGIVVDSDGKIYDFNRFLNNSELISLE